MSSANPTYTASSVVSDIEARLRTPGLSTTVYLPWISVAYQRVYQKLSEIGQHAKQEYFGAYDTISLGTDTPNEYTITDEIPRYGGLIAVFVKYGLSTDQYNIASKLRSMSQWPDWTHISTTYRGKDQPVYYILGPLIGFIPVPPESGAIAKIYYVKRPYQITDGADVIDIPYRFIYPILTYVQARALERVHEDYVTAKALDRQFEQELEDIAQAAASEFNEDDYAGIDVPANSPIYNDPFRS